MIEDQRRVAEMGQRSAQNLIMARSKLAYSLGQVFDKRTFLDQDSQKSEVGSVVGERDILVSKRYVILAYKDPKKKTECEGNGVFCSFRVRNKGSS